MAIRDTFFAEKHKKGENLSKTFEDKVLKNEASEKDSHMWLMGCPNPCKLEQKLECTFLKPFIQVKIK